MILLFLPPETTSLSEEKRPTLQQVSPPSPVTFNNTIHGTLETRISSFDCMPVFTVTFSPWVVVRMGPRSTGTTVDIKTGRRSNERTRLFTE